MGDGFRTFQSGEVLTSSNVQNYLMDQSVMVFAGTAARSSAIASPETGMLTYRTDGTADAKRQGFEFYDGASYVRLVPQGAMSLITSTTISAAATTNVNDVFSADFPNYRIVFDGTASTGTNQPLSMRLRVSGSDANTGYEYERLYNYSNTVAADRNVLGTDEWFVADTNASAKYFFEVIVFAPFSAAPTKMLVRAGADNGVTGFQNVSVSGYNSNATSYTGFSLITGGTISGSLQVYGMRST